MDIMPLRLRAYCFTINNYTPEELEKLREYSTKCRYLVFGFEIAPTTGTPHIQGFMQPKTRVRVSTLQKCISSGIHVEETRGTPQQAADYCKKDGNFEEFGELIDPGDQGAIGGEMEKKRWRLISQMAREHKFTEIEELDPCAYIRCYFSIKAIAKDHLMRVEDLSKPTGVWIHGPSGVGKSYGIREVCYHHELPMYDKPCNKWWDGYDYEPVVLIDDFDKTHACLAHYLKRWGDSYSFTAEVKNSAIRIRPRMVVVTSQYPIEGIWDDAESRDAIRRRYEQVYLNNLESALKWRDLQKSEKIEFHNRHNLSL